jgi:hypothetical protein
MVWNFSIWIVHFSSSCWYFLTSSFNLLTSVIAGACPTGSDKSDGVVSVIGAVTVAFVFLTSISSISKLRIEAILCEVCEFELLEKSSQAK